MLQQLKVTSDQLCTKRAAFKLLFDREPVIYTAHSFTDCDGECVFGSVKVYADDSLGPVILNYSTDGTDFKARIDAIDYFTFE